MVIGVSGIVITLFGVLGYLLAGDLSPLLLQVHIGVGVVLLLIWFISTGFRSLLVGAGKLTPVFAIFLKCLLALAFFVLVNLLSLKYPVQFDLTEQKVNSLDPQTESVVRELTGQLHIAALKPSKSNKLADIERLLFLIKEVQPERITTSLIDPLREPLKLKALGIMNKEVAKLELQTAQGTKSLKVQSLTEQALTEGLVKLLRKKEKVLYRITGHGEPGSDRSRVGALGSLFDDLSARGIKTKPLLLSMQKEVPQDSEALVIIRPEKEYLNSDIDKIRSYINSSGRVFFALDPRSAPKLRALLAEYNIIVGEDVIIDQIQRLHESPQLGTQPLVRKYSDHPINATLSDDSYTKFNLASSVLWKEADSAEIEAIAYTSENAWAESNLKLLLDTIPPLSSKDIDDVSGPVSIAVAYRRGDSRLVVFGDSDWLLNGNIDVFYNRDLARGGFDWIAGYDSAVTIAPRTYRTSLTPVSHSSFRYILTASFILPELLLLFGIVLWWVRRGRVGHLS